MPSERRGGSPRLLLVEDNAINQKVALGLLRKLGLEADVVRDGAAALEALASTDYDLVLMDVEMPGMNGCDATRALRAPPSSVRNRVLPVIAMTANATRGDRDLFLAAGMSDYLAKPIDFAELRDVLDRWLPGGAHARDAALRGLALASASLSLPPGPVGSPDEGVPVLDLGALRERFLDDDHFLEVSVGTFLARMPACLEELGARLAAGDARGVQNEVHAVKGLAATFGGERMRVVATALERLAREGALAAVAARLPELLAEHAALAAALTANVPRR